MTIDEVLANVKPTFFIPRPSCEAGGELQYRSVQSDGVYCALSNEKCPYHESVKNKDLCVYGLGSYNHRWTVTDYYDLVGGKRRMEK